VTSRLRYIAANTFREAVRDRVLYNLIAFALILVAAAPLFGKISIGLERIVLINLGLSTITVFGIVIAIFIGIGLVSKEIEKRTLYTVLARPVRRWEFICGKYLGLAGTLAVNTFFMALGLFGALLFVTHKLERADVSVLLAVYFILLQFLMITAIAIFFSSFTTPIFSALFSFAVFVMGSFSDDLRGFAAMTQGVTRQLTFALSHAVPNFGAMNVVSQVAHGNSLPPALMLHNTLYAIFYSGMALSAAVLVFERRDLK
jgi:Cu-processing system permease protein